MLLIVDKWVPEALSTFFEVEMGRERVVRIHMGKGLEEGRGVQNSA